VTKLVFLGTKGEIEESSSQHQYHSSLLMLAEGTRLLIDYGRLHRYRLEEIAPEAILITHAHPDHYLWLEEEVKTEIPVYLTRETLDYGKFKPLNPQIIEPGAEFAIPPFSCLAYRVLHSVRCPAVGYKIRTPEKTIIYNPDLVDIVGKESILEGASYYIGDGSAIRANLVRRQGDQIFGHARITTQINWCRKHGIPNIIFTHLGRETMEQEEAFRAEHADITLAYDGMELVI